MQYNNIMRISKFTYTLIASILLLSFWNFRPVVSLLNRDIILVLTLLWTILGFCLFPKKLSYRYFHRFNWLWIIFFTGIFISMLNAYFFWEQPLKTTFIAQRFSYTFILLPALFYVQSSPYDIEKTLRIISYITLVMWVISIIRPELIGNISEEAIENRNFNPQATTDIGYYVTGIHIVVLYTYFLIQNYIKNFNFKAFLTALFWITFIILYQNRSLIIGIIIIFLYSVIRLKSRHKPIIIGCICIIGTILITYTLNIWESLWEESQTQLADEDYNRWKALYYYLYDYSPNLWCYLLGNGMPSGGNSYMGNLMWLNMERGIFTSDLGMIGMWIDYGLLPLIGIYYTLIRLLIKRYFPLWLKFASFHILLVPTIFQFQQGIGILFFVLIIYMYVYYKIKHQIDKKNAQRDSLC